MGSNATEVRLRVIGPHPEPILKGFLAPKYRHLFFEAGLFLVNEQRDMLIRKEKK
jgi:hypothetical protein